MRGQAECYSQFLAFPIFCHEIRGHAVARASKNRAGAVDRRHGGEKGGRSAASSFFSFIRPEKSVVKTKKARGLLEPTSFEYI